jgi:hypothetical protein
VGDVVFGLKWQVWRQCGLRYRVVVEKMVPSYHQREFHGSAAQREGVVVEWNEEVSGVRL